MLPIWDVAWDEWDMVYYCGGNWGYSTCLEVVRWTGWWLVTSEEDDNDDADDAARRIVLVTWLLFIRKVRASCWGWKVGDWRWASGSQNLASASETTDCALAESRWVSEWVSSREQKEMSRLYFACSRSGSKWCRRTRKVWV